MKPERILPAATPRPRARQRQVQAWLAEWQKALRLQDWLLRIEIKREKDMESEGCHGTCHYSPALKNATIVLRDSIDFRDGAGYPEDLEATIVHELLHLHFAPFYITKGLVNTFQEQAIEVIAHSLVGLKRRGEAMAKGGGKKIKRNIPAAAASAKPSGTMKNKGDGKGMGKMKAGKGC
jgi:hypothetical protein